MNPKALADRLDRLESLNRLTQRVMLALIRNPPDSLMNASLDNITCDLCNNAAWWPDNGFTEADRRAYCGPDGLDCPGFDKGE